MSSPFATPASSSGVDWNALDGALLIFAVRGIEPNIPTAHGDKDAVKADVDVVDGAKAGERYENAYIFGTAMVPQLQPNIGSKVLGRLYKGEAKNGKNPPWLLREATEQEVAAATAYLNKQFATPDAGAAEAAPPF